MIKNNLDLLNELIAQRKDIISKIKSAGIWESDASDLRRALESTDRTIIEVSKLIKQE